LYNILIEFGNRTNLEGLIKMCRNETYSTVRVGKNLSGVLPVRNGLRKGDALSLLLLHFALGYVIRRVRINQDSLKFIQWYTSVFS
jgi:hypothetical protein